MKRQDGKKVYVLMVSRTFPAYHPRKGEETGFPDKIIAEIKRRTIRGNYKLWKYRADEVKAGRAVISLRYWLGKPYNSKQVEFAELSDITVQRCHIYQIKASKPLTFDRTLIFLDDNITPIRRPFMLANSDGLSMADFCAWFKKPCEDMALINFGHFTFSNNFNK